MKWRHRDGLYYLQFPSLDLPGFFHGIFLRYSTDHAGRQASFHLGLNSGDENQRVWENRRRIRDLFDAQTMVFTRQVHGSDISVCHSGSKGGKQDHNYMKGDAMMTAYRGQALFIQVADCQPVLLADPVRKVVANVHSGWRGSVQNIIGLTINRMIHAYGCRAENIICGIGPSLGPCCAEFIHFRQEIPQPYWRYRRPGDYFDFWQMSIDQMTAAGIKPGHVALSGICTRCNPHLFFSYRAETDTGRFAAVIGMRD